MTVRMLLHALGASVLTFTLELVCALVFQWNFSEWGWELFGVAIGISYGAYLSYLHGRNELDRWVERNGRVRRVIRRKSMQNG